jgi:hypothetical protein
MKNKAGSEGPQDLRMQAEVNLESEPDRPCGIRLEEANQLIHELRVHQIELEIQEHGGQIWYEGRPDGSNFVFTISREAESEARM